MEAKTLVEANILISLLVQQRDLLNNEYIKALSTNILQQNIIIELQESINSNK